MDNAYATGVIAVGVDGSDGSHRALDWALDEARRRSCAVEVVTAWPLRPSEIDLTDEQVAAAYRRADEVQRHAVDRALRHREHAPVVSYEVVRGDPVEVLVNASSHAQLLVIGSHGTASVRHAGLGSASEACARLAACPVVVMPVPAPTMAHVDEVAPR